MMPAISTSSEALPDGATKPQRARAFGEREIAPSHERATLADIGARPDALLHTPSDELTRGKTAVPPTAAASEASHDGARAAVRCAREGSGWDRSVSNAKSQIGAAPAK